MTTFLLTDVNKSIRVEYKTDLLNNSNSAFTVMDIVGLDDAEIALGVNINRSVHNKQELIDIATDLDLKLEAISASGTETIVDFSGIYYNDGLGVDNL